MKDHLESLDFSPVLWRMSSWDMLQASHLENLLDLYALKTNCLETESQVGRLPSNRRWKHQRPHIVVCQQVYRTHLMP